MKKVVFIVYSLFSFLFLLYLILPNPSFPLPLPDSTQSFEQADTETPFRRAYFTNFTRIEVMQWYDAQLSKLDFFGMRIPFFADRLNYPPEESQVLIRDQTRSTFLEEINHPLRESIFVNGWEPKDPKDDVWYKGIDYRQKIIVRFVPSSRLVRVFAALPAIWLGWILLLQLSKITKEVPATIRKYLPWTHQ